MSASRSMEITGWTTKVEPFDFRFRIRNLEAEIFRRAAEKICLNPL
jgi:hypothetical protein